MPTLAFELGVGFNDFTNSSFDVSDPYFTMEWQLPPFSQSWQLSLFLERQVSTLSLLGIRIAYDMGASLREAARHDGWRIVR